MNYENFKKELTEKLEERATMEGYRLVARKVLRINESLDSVTCFSDEKKVSPTFFINHLYEGVENTSIEKIIDKIMDITKNEKFPNDNKKVMDVFLNAKENVFPTLINV